MLRSREDQYAASAMDTPLVDARLVGDPLVSGGAFGLEASVIALVVAGGAGVWLVRRAVRAGEVMAPWRVRRRLAAAA